MNFDDFIYRYRFYLGTALVVVILLGSGYLVWNKFGNKLGNNQNTEIADLQKQNDILRAELSGQSQQVAGASTESENQSDKININIASATELDKLPGIGPARAADIVSYREAHDGFKTIEELKNIKGIGDATFEKLKDSVTVGE